MRDYSEIWHNFIVIEGLDGSGTTTQLRRLKTFGAEHNHPVWTTWEPTDNPVGLLIRKVLRKEEDVSAETLARLFSTDRFEHLYAPGKGIRPRLDRGETVICDRYIFSSLAYQSLDCGFERVLELNDYPLPEKLIYIDVPWQVCQERRNERDMEELFEGAPIQQRIHDNYERALALFADRGMTIHRIDGTRSSDEVFEEIRKLLFPVDRSGGLL